MQVITRDGRRFSGGGAVLFVLETVGWHPVVMRLARRRPVIWIVNGGYRVVADHRNAFSRIFFRSRPDS